MSRWKWIGRPTVLMVYVLAVTYMAGKRAIRYAYLERGYDAIGGEYFFIPMMAWAVYKLFICYCEAQQFLYLLSFHFLFLHTFHPPTHSKIY